MSLAQMKEPPRRRRHDATGQVVVRELPGRTMYALRVRVHGGRFYYTLGSDKDGWTRERAESERERVHGEIVAGRFAPPRREDQVRDAAEVRAALIRSRRAKLAESRRSAEEAYSLIRKAAQALDSAERETPSREARAACRAAWPAIHELEDALTRAIKAP